MTREEADQWAKNSAYKNSLYHGTTEKGMLNIPKDGFDLSYKANGRMYGDGVYFGTRASDARSYGNVLETRINVKNPFYAKNSFALQKATDDGLAWYKTLPKDQQFELESYNDLLTRFLKSNGHDPEIIY